MLRGDFAGFQGLSLWWIWSCKAEELAEALEYEYCSRVSFPTACVCQEELWPTGKASWTPGEGGMAILGKPAVKKETNCITSRFLAYQRSSAPDFWGKQRLCQQHLPYEGWAWGHAVIACSPQQIITSLPTSSCAWRSYIILKRNISCYPAAREKEGGPECSQLVGGQQCHSTRVGHTSLLLIWLHLTAIPTCFHWAEPCVCFSAAHEKSQGTVHKLKCLHREGKDGAASAPPLVISLQSLG